MLSVLALAAMLASPDTIRADEVRAAYPDIFKVALDSGAYGWTASVRVDTLPPEHRLASFVRERKQYLAYFATIGLHEHGAGVQLGRADARDSVRRSFYARLARDTAYERGILGALAAYLRVRNGALVGYAPPVTRAISLRQAVAVAARFYNPNVIAPDGRIGVHICSAENGLFRTLGRRDIVLEAVAFAAVWDDTSRPDSTSMAGKDFGEAYTRVRALPRDGSPTERIARAQAMMWSTLESGTGLHHLLRDVEQRWPDLPIAFAP